MKKAMLTFALLGLVLLSTTSDSGTISPFSDKNDIAG